MREKFDFTAEMNEAKTVKSNPHNEFLEEENRLLNLNVKELAKLNDNVHELRTKVEKLSESIQKCEPYISDEMQNLALKFGATLLCNFVGQIENKCKVAERRRHCPEFCVNGNRIKKAANFIPIPATAFYITIIILVALSSFFVCIIVANTEILHSAVIWKAVTWCSAMAVLGIAITILLPKVLK